ncbi:unnamed protein product, partial [Prunus brigantina]
KKKKLLRIFVGSSVGDLSPLVEAEIGIVINPCDHLLATLYLVNSWHEIIAFIFRACGARNEKPPDDKKPPHGDILEPKSAKPKNVGVKTLSDSRLYFDGSSDIFEPKSVKLSSAILTILPKPKSATKLPSTEDEAETVEDENQLRSQRLLVLAKPPHCDILVPKSANVSFTLRALLPKPKNAGVNTLSLKSATLLAFLPKPKSAAKVSSAENAEDENVKDEKQQNAGVKISHLNLQSYLLHFWQFCLPKSATKLPSVENEAEIAEDENQQVKKPKSACAKPPHCDILESKSAKLSSTLWALLTKPKNAGVKTLSHKSAKLPSTLLAFSPTPKSAAKLPSAENEAETAEDENVEAE